MTSPTFSVSPGGLSITYNGQQYFLPGNTWSTNSDGSVTFNGSVWFPAGTDIATGTGIVVFGPGGGTATFPAVQPGPPGPATKYTFQMVQVAYGVALPTTNPAVTPTEWDSYGNPVALNVTFYVNSGAAGKDGETTISAELDGVTALQGFMIGFDPSNQAARWQQIPVGNWYNATGFAASASNTTTQKLIGSVNVPGQPYSWWPEITGQALIIGAVDTQVNLVARVGGSKGAICGYGYGAAGATPPPITAISSGLGVGSANIVAAGAATNIYLYAENQTASPNAWSTTASAIFQVRPSFVPTTL